MRKGSRRQGWVHYVEGSEAASMSSWEKKSSRSKEERRCLTRLIEKNLNRDDGLRERKEMARAPKG